MISRSPGAAVCTCCVYVLCLGCAVSCAYWRNAGCTRIPWRGTMDRCASALFFNTWHGCSPAPSPFCLCRSPPPPHAPRPTPHAPSHQDYPSLLLGTPPPSWAVQPRSHNLFFLARSGEEQEELPAGAPGARTRVFLCPRVQVVCAPVAAVLRPPRVPLVSSLLFLAQPCSLAVLGVVLDFAPRAGVGV